MMSTLMVFHPAHASTSISQRLMHTEDGRTCITNPHGQKDFVCIRDSERKVPIPHLHVPRLLSHQYQTRILPC